MTSYPFSSIIFDLDGTLVDTAPDLTGALNHVLGLNNLDPVSVQQVRDIVGYGARITIERGFSHYGIRLDTSALDEAQDQFLAHYAANICKTSTLYPGVQDVIKEFGHAGIRMGVCTNKTEVLAVDLLTQLGVAPSFATICGSDTVPNKKPHPDHVLTALDRMSGEPSTSILVGDSQADVQSGQAAGLPVIAMTYGYTAIPTEALGADVVLDSFADIPKTLEAWVR
ncbi:phosphoglycolate phosphatase [Cohaesibacter sp. ES.047]|uniref:phosphoglycolate phosphatase n=1 Tax=Cohaesibacter sp. ES.047 TaxID=1798205 RepID=UPI000BB813E5|nr:phosphoglycolate phosphatase [Cohaesibacter sp. ES.047]SNY93041.1 phosphoglycolate phosphatase [Cohaesibacter sp. ES.047]